MPLTNAEKQKRFRARHRIKILLALKKWRQTHVEHRRAYKKAWNERNREKIREYDRSRWKSHRKNNIINNLFTFENHYEEGAYQES